ncbi:MAG: adenine phosphoribosyltransferase [Tissierellia bacterium]|nr:adenine phosphoribosyltransferase [Tissierellia bacterium]
MDLSKTIRSIKDYPAKGIIFRDITTMLKDPAAFREAIDQMTVLAGDNVDKIVGIEARGFIMGSPIAYKMGKGFVPIRKPGKLPLEKVSESYALEYGTDRIEMHADAIEKGEHIVIVDDLLATGGTSKAAIQMIEQCGGIVDKLIFLIELEDLKGRAQLEGYQVESIIKY